MIGVIIFFIALALIGTIVWIKHNANRYNIRGFKADMVHRNGTKYDNEGYDYYGYNSKGYNNKNMHISGSKYNEEGFDYQGYNSLGFNSYKHYRNGSKYDDFGFDHIGFNRQGLHKNGTKYDVKGYDIDGYNSNGFNEKLIHKNGTRYNNYGYNFHAFDKYKYTKDGIDERGIPWWYEPKNTIMENNYYTKFIKIFTKKNIKNFNQASLFINNSFNILGLASNSLNSNIVRRAMELEKFSKANIKKSYDFTIYPIHRTLNKKRVYYI